MDCQKFINTKVAISSGTSPGTSLHLLLPVGEQINTPGSLHDRLLTPVGWAFLCRFISQAQCEKYWASERLAKP